VGGLCCFGFVFVGFFLGVGCCFFCSVLYNVVEFWVSIDMLEEVGLWVECIGGGRGGEIGDWFVGLVCMKCGKSGFMV
jgi:hypothetical protein